MPLAIKFWHPCLRVYPHEETLQQQQTLKLCLSTHERKTAASTRSPSTLGSDVKCFVCLCVEHQHRHQHGCLHQTPTTTQGDSKAHTQSDRKILTHTHRWRRRHTERERVRFRLTDIDADMDADADTGTGEHDPHSGEHDVFEIVEDGSLATCKSMSFATCPKVAKLPNRKDMEPQVASEPRCPWCSAAHRWESALHPLRISVRPFPSPVALLLLSFCFPFSPIFPFFSHFLYHLLFLSLAFSARCFLLVSQCFWSPFLFYPFLYVCFLSCVFGFPSCVFFHPSCVLCPLMFVCHSFWFFLLCFLLILCFLSLPVFFLCSDVQCFSFMCVLF